MLVVCHIVAYYQKAILFYCQITFHGIDISCFIYSLVDVYLGALLKKSVINIDLQVFVWVCVFIFLPYINLGVEWPEHM
jgi:hypothetical protein